MNGCANVDRDHDLHIMTMTMMKIKMIITKIRGRKIGDMICDLNI